MLYRISRMLYFPEGGNNQETKPTCGQIQKKFKNRGAINRES